MLGKSSSISIEFALQVVEKSFGIKCSAVKLPGELDLNFKILSPEGRCYILKIAHESEEIQILRMQHLSLIHI